MEADINYGPRNSKTIILRFKMAILPSLTTFLKLNFKFKKQIPNFRIIYRAYVFPGEIVTVLNVMNFSNFTFNFTETFKLYT